MLLKRNQTLTIGSFKGNKVATEIPGEGQPHIIHGTGMFTCMDGWFLWHFHVGEYTSPMDCDGHKNYTPEN